MQQLVAGLIVLAAAAYLGRQFVTAARAFFSAKSGCGSGCGKCAFAAKEGGKNLPKSTPAKPSNLISLSDIRTLPGKQK